MMKTIFECRPRFPLYSAILWLFAGGILCWSAAALTEDSAAVKYPDAVLRATGGKQPFNPANTSTPYELPLKKLIEARRGIYYGSAIKLAIEPLGERVLLVDTAARGVLLKGADMNTKDLVRAPEWVLPGPGLQTGVFRILGRLSWHEFSMGPAVAELFLGRGFAWVDGIISTELFSPWRVQLDFRKSRLSLLSYKTPFTQVPTEWEARLDRNWWIVTAKLRNKPAHLLLDSGASQTYLGEEWMLRNFGDMPRRQRPVRIGEADYFEAGIWAVEIPGAPLLHIQCFYTGPGQMPVSTGIPIDGVLGFDALHELALELDYSSQKLYILR
jgi:hypothetical protein